MKNREKQHKTNPIIIWTNKRDLRASGLSLLPLALRPLLLMFLMLGFSFILQNSYVSAASLTLTIPSGISLKVKPEETATFNKSEESTLSVNSDANFGYTLSIKSKNTDNNLIDGSNKITSIGSAISEGDFSSKGANNTWGYLPSKLNSADNSHFQPGPTDSESILNKTSSKNDSVNNDYKITLAAKIDNNLVAGTYKNTFVLTASANTVSYSINYNLNSGSWADTSPQTGSTTEPSIKLSDITPTRSGYEFKGWCSVETNNDSCNDGTIYEVNGDYELTNGANNLNLWAMWKSTVPTMQDFTCNLADGATTTITDSRDGKKYTVAKLKDGKCWMTQNLRIGSDSSTTLLDSSNTDIASGSYVLPKGDLNKTDFSDPNGAFVYISDSDAWYSWSAATAAANSSVSESSQSICPKGWRLPTNIEYNNLITQQGMENLTKAPANFVLGGSYSANSYNSSGGYYLSSTTVENNVDSIYYLMMISNIAIMNSNNAMYEGMSVRCVARTDLSKSNNLNMQDVGKWGGDLLENQTIEAIDIRDNNKYMVSRLSDGHLWMTSNLRIENKTLNSTDSDVNSDFVLPSGNSSEAHFQNWSFDQSYVYIDNTYGGYYSWYAATAGEGRWLSNGDTNTYHSICPKGWKLPNSSLHFTNLNKLYKDNVDNQLLKDPISFQKGGIYVKSSINHRGEIGYYWSTERARGLLNDADNYSIDLVINDLSANLDIDDKRNGLSIRCINRQEI